MSEHDEWRRQGPRHEIDPYDHGQLQKECNNLRTKNQELVRILYLWLDFYSADECKEPHRRDERLDYIRLGEKAHRLTIKGLTQ